ncbi:MAG: serine/threonine-protein kinase [Janthinobacterium lividum]
MAEARALLADRYRLVREVGRGGMGVVWEAWDERLERPVAVKELRPQLGLSPEEAELAKNRAMREARITARLHHRNAVPVFDVVEHAGQPCLIMQFLPSVPLSAVLREGGPLGVHEAARFGAEVSSALAAAHQLGIVHRDVKPGNILITDDGAALISDFGISHALGDATLTSTGLVHGTPAYLAPEVARGAESSYASDVFSLGATLYACLEGAPPFGTDSNSIALLYRVASGEFAPPQRAGALAPVLLEMLRPDPAARPAMREVAARLAAVEAGNTPTPLPLPMTVPTPVPTPTTGPTTVAPASTETTGTTQVRRSTGPATFAATLPTVAAPPAPPTPPTPSVLPSQPGPDPTGRRRRAPRVLAAVALLVGLVVLATALVAGQLGRGGNGTAAAPATASDSRTAARPTASSKASSKPSSTASRSTSTSSGSPSSTTSSSAASPSPSATSSSSTGEPTATELEDAITGYYALVPDDTDGGWARLTKDYQSGTSGGRQSYEQFWDQVDRVSVSKVEASPPSRVVATVTYRRGDRTEVDRTSFRVVRDDGVLKIAASSVIGSG